MSRSSAAAAPRPRPPHSRLPLFYFTLAHLCLAAAFAALAFVPRHFAGFFYHPRMVAVVHLVTLGWISASILGALYMIAPMALRTRLPARPLDYGAFSLVVVGVTGMVAHFWLDRPPGMVWAAGTVTAGLLWVAGRTIAALRGAPIPVAVKLHFWLAFLNLLGAATLGILLGLNKVVPVLRGFVLTNVYAHAHLAALGWAAMMVMAAGYRLLPMLLPAAMPEGRGLYLSAALLEAGTVGLFVSLLLRSRAVALFAPVAVAGFAAFLAQVVWMRRHPKPAPKELPRPDFGVLHAMQAFLYLVLAAVLGLVLAFAPAAAWKFRAALVYGTFGLVGFLSQMVVGVSNRLLPLYAWLRAYERTEFAVQPASPHATPVRALQAATFGLWTAGVPLLAAGLGLERTLLVSAGAAALLLGVLLGGAGNLLVFRRSLAALPRATAAGRR
jgi:hypothetical protein